MPAANSDTNFDDLVTFINDRNTGVAGWPGIAIGSTSLDGTALKVETAGSTTYNMNLKDNSTDVFNVLSGGSYLIPLQPGSNACVGTDQPFSTEATVRYNNETGVGYDVQSEFNTSTYTYTATKRGVYFFHAQATITPYSSSDSFFKLSVYAGGSVSSSATSYIQFPVSGVHTEESMSLSGCVFVQDAGTIYATIECLDGADSSTLENNATRSYLVVRKLT